MLAVKSTPNFAEWWINLTEEERTFLSLSIEETRAEHANLPFSPLAQMGELNVERPTEIYRILYALDAKTHTLILAGGLKKIRPH